MRFTFCRMRTANAARAIQALAVHATVADSQKHEMQDLSASVGQICSKLACRGLGMQSP